MSRRRQVRPRGSALVGGDWWPWLIVAVGAVAVAASSCVWVGGRVAAAVGGNGFTGPGWSLTLVADVATDGWPGANPAAVWIWSALLFALLAGALSWAGRLLWQRRPERSTVRPLGTPRDVAGMGAAAAAGTACRLRRSLRDVDPEQMPLADRGVLLGRLAARRKHLIFATWEQVVLVLFGPRGGKTSSIAVEATVSAPGAVVVTSNKADAYLLTHRVRARDTGARVWVLDPQQIAYVPQTWWWNPLGGRMSVGDAERLASAFVMSVNDEERREIWGAAARELLANLMMAAHVGGLTLREVYRWLHDAASTEPVSLLSDAGYVEAAEALQASQRLPDRTRGSVYFTAQVGMACLRDPQIAAWVTPRPGLAEFRPATFVRSRETLYLLSKDAGAGLSAAALVAALVDEVRVAAERAGEASGGRLDPPLVLVLDEAANIVRISSLPKWYSHLGSRGIIPITILQSYPQGEQVWGKGGMKELSAAATIKLVGPGLDDPEFLDTVSRWIGEEEVDVVSYSTGGHGHGSRSTSTRRQRIMPVEALRALRQGEALLFAPTTRPITVALQPWFTGPRQKEIEADESAARNALLTRVRRSEQAAADEVAADLAAAGVRVIDIPAGWLYDAPHELVGNLAGEPGGAPFTADSHRSCPGHAAFVQLGTPVYVCTHPERYVHHRLVRRDSPADIDDLGAPVPTPGLH